MKVSFTACHSGKLQLACTSPQVISTSPKPFLISTIDNNPSVIWISPTNSTCPSGKLRTRITGPIAKSTSPGLSDATLFARWTKSDRRSKLTWSKCVLCIPYIHSGSPNKCWLHTCDTCIITTYKIHNVFQKLLPRMCTLHLCRDIDGPITWLKIKRFCNCRFISFFSQLPQLFKPCL